MIPQLQTKLRASILAAFLFPSILATAQTPATDLNTNFVGKWTGQLEYRDFQSNAQVFLPTWLTITETADHKALQFNYVYDDGPSKTVRELTMVAFYPAAEKITFTSDREKSSDTYTIQGLDDFSKTGRGTLILMGSGKESDKPIDVRITLTLRRNLYTYRKETRQRGEDFKFRDAYTFTRAEPPASQ